MAIFTGLTARKNMGVTQHGFFKINAHLWSSGIYLGFLWAKSNKRHNWMQNTNQEILLEMELRLSLKTHLPVQHIITKPEKGVLVFWQIFSLRKINKETKRHFKLHLIKQLIITHHIKTWTVTATCSIATTMKTLNFHIIMIVLLKHPSWIALLFVHRVELRIKSCPQISSLILEARPYS